MTIPVETSMTTLAEHEAVIERGLTTFIEVGNALLAIRDGRLYREQFATFENYCQMRWGWDRRYANRVIAGSEVAGRLGSTDPKPTTETQVRPLTKLPAEEQPQAWQQAVEAAGGKVPTQAQVERVVRQRIVDEEEPAYGETWVDEGVPVREVWEEADEAFAAELEAAGSSANPPTAGIPPREERRAQAEREAAESDAAVRGLMQVYPEMGEQIRRREMQSQWRAVLAGARRGFHQFPPAEVIALFDPAELQPELVELRFLRRSIDEYLETAQRPGLRAVPND